MWTLARWNSFYQKVEIIDTAYATEGDAREVLQLCIDDEYCDHDIETYSEEYDEGMNAIVITVDDDEYYIWED